MGGNIVQFLFFLRKKNMALAIFEISPLCTVPARDVAWYPCWYCLCSLGLLVPYWSWAAAVTGITAWGTGLVDASTASGITWVATIGREGRDEELKVLDPPAAPVLLAFTGAAIEDASELESWVLSGTELQAPLLHSPDTGVACATSVAATRLSALQAQPSELVSWGRRVCLRISSVLPPLCVSVYWLLDLLWCGHLWHPRVLGRGTFCWVMDVLLVGDWRGETKGVLLPGHVMPASLLSKPGGFFQSIDGVFISLTVRHCFPSELWGTLPLAQNWLQLSFSGIKSRGRDCSYSNNLSLIVSGWNAYDWLQHVFLILANACEPDFVVF